MNAAVNKFLLWDKFMPKMNLRNSGFTCSD